MKNSLISGYLLGAFLLLQGRSASAQATNIVMDAYFVLNGLTQAPSGKVIGFRILSKDIIAALNATGDFDFGPGAKLLLSSTDDNVPVIVVRETRNGQRTTTDVGAYFGVTDVGSEVHTPNHLLAWGVWAFAFDNGQGTDFHLWGLNTLRRRTFNPPGVGELERTYQVVVPVSGQGDVKGANSVYYGNVYAINGRVEVQ